VELTNKNIILYDEFGGVSGFAEFKIRSNKTDIKVRHNLNEAVLQLSVMANGEGAKVFNITSVSSSFELRDHVDAEKEIFVVLRKGEEVLASGVINQGQIDRRLEVTELAHENAVAVVKQLDEALRKVCIIDEDGQGQCSHCPYREHFFGGVVVSEDEVVV